LTDDGWQNLHVVEAMIAVQHEPGQKARQRLGRAPERLAFGEQRVIVGHDEDLYSKTLATHRNNLISVAELREPKRVAVKIRHRHEPAAATLEKSGEDELLVTFDQPQRAITPGQAAVFYDGEIVVGGGWIV
jgi:tRNA U34 2-thiouridine synthase MnmA/TrmU